jgi:asparagine synthase (glutamine-hydrolysing)
MCGIVGFISNKSEININKILENLNHRGPDFKSSHTIRSLEKNITFGQTRLGIIDVNSFDSNQPVYDDRYMMVFNGEIYNYKELSNEYLQSNNFKSDTLVLFELLKKDISFVNNLKGMFAISFFDTVEKRLHLFSDYFGKKPIYYASKNNNFYFASEIKALKEFDEIDFTLLSKKALFSYLSYNYTPIDQSIYYDIKKLEAGSHLVYDLNTNTIYKEKYFDMYTFKNDVKSVPLDYNHFKELAIEAVKRRYVADVDVAIQLSSGIDSSLVGAISKHILGFEPHAFTVGIKDSIQSESEEAKKIANDLNFKHDVLYIEPKDLFDIMKIHTNIYDEPFADSSSIPTYFLNKKIHELRYRVLLAGDGGDEFWLGYNRYMHALKIQKIQKYSFLKNTLYKLVNTNVVRKVMYYIFKKKYDLREFDYRIMQISKILKTDNAEEYYEFVITQGNNSKLLNFKEKTYEFYESEEILDQISMSDASFYMQGDIFVKNDRASMANSVETRSPLVDIDLVKYSLAVNNDEKIVNNETKYPLRKLLKEIYPDYDFDMPKKGFGIPLFDWLKIEYIKSEIVTTIESLYTYDEFNHKHINDVLDDFYQKNLPNAYQVWNLYLLAQFLNKNNLKNITLK